ncbi:MAG: prepilin-type cleavage/methylation domain-containing protein, partial [Proteobacteria bacterium]|nr:prepilin-type cleavage/methylation domain-containing protein [Pseudomonadota bacterium]
IIAASIVVFFKPAFDSYLAAGRRARLSELADTALRKMSRDIRLAVPNSIRSPSDQCFELVPTTAGGRYRMGPDTSPGAPSNGWFDGTAAVSVLDVLTPLSSTPAAGDWLVIDNQNTNDVYSGTNRAAIQSVATPPALDPNLAYYYHRITLQAATQFPGGYNGGRFVVVPNAQNAAFYVCSGAGVDSGGSGTGTLYRFANYGYNAATPAACPVPVVGTTPVLVSKVRKCSFVYSPNQGATQQSGFVWMNLEIAEQGERIVLVHGTHVDNVP